MYHQGRSVADKRLILYMKKNGLPESRLGISVSKKYGNSVERHLFQRRIREIIRLHEGDLPAGRDYVVIARKDAASCDYHMLEGSLLKLLARFHGSASVGDDK